jgi:hypothetical protein
MLIDSVEGGHTIDFVRASAVSSSNLLSSCFKNTTCLPRNLPVRRINTVPGVIESCSFVRLAVLRDCIGLRMSSAG